MEEDRMEERKIHFQLWLTRDEHRDLVGKAKKAGLPISAFLRQAVAGQEVLEAPPADIPALIREVRQVRSCLERLLKAAESGDMPEASGLREALDENRALEKRILGAYGC